MQTSALSPQGYLTALPPPIQGTAAGEFFSGLMRGLTHKQNNLLAVIQGFSSLLLMDEGLDSVTRENLEHIKEAAQGAATLAERILAASGCARLSPQTVRLDEYVPLMESAFRAPFSRLNVPFQIRVAPDLPPVRVDGARFKDLLLELLTNAAEAAAEAEAEGVAGTALMEVRPAEADGEEDGIAGAGILIHNTGLPIPPEKLPEVFKPFHSTRDSRHYGIGLTIAAVLASQMGMKLAVKSEAGATTFRLRIPAAG